MAASSVSALFLTYGCAAILLCAVPSAWAKAPAGRYLLDAPAGTVYDSFTKLTWQRDGSASGTKTWADAKAYCAGLAAAGGGWKLPDIVQLRSIVDLDQVDPAIDPTAFPNAPSSFFWSSTPLQGAPTAAWIVGFKSGFSYSVEVVPFTYRVRCVR